jgi:hypothetical protein
LAAQSKPAPPNVLPASSVAQLARSLDAATSHPSHIWRDTPPTNSDGTVNAYVEIARGDLRKWELDMRANARAIDRVMPESIGGYPVNYGFVPQTVSYDGDPFDALVLGPPLAGGEFVRGVIVGLMYMEDEKGLDSKVVLSVPDVRVTRLARATSSGLATTSTATRGTNRGGSRKCPGGGLLPKGGPSSRPRTLSS